MRAIGVILDGCTIAESSPASTHSCRNTELSTMREAAFKPNETLLTPSVVCTSGNSSFKARIASIVSIPSRRVSSCPVAIGKVKQSIRMSPVAMPQLVVKSIINRRATLSFHSLLRAWPSSSIVKATTLAPCSCTNGIILAKREVGPSPSS